MIVNDTLQSFEKLPFIKNESYDIFLYGSSPSITLTNNPACILLTCVVYMFFNTMCNSESIRDLLYVNTFYIFVLIKYITISLYLPHVSPFYMVCRQYYFFACLPCVSLIYINVAYIDTYIFFCVFSFY